MPELLTAQSSTRASTAPWVIVIVDDEPDMHDVTQLVLENLTFEGRPVEILSAYSGAEGQRLFEQRADIAVGLIDVVMEHDRAGLDLVRHVRGSLGNTMCRLILRTGQPGMAPEREIVTHFDIDDYKEKTELTADRLYAVMYSALRSYQALQGLEQTRRALVHIADTASCLMQCQGTQRFVNVALAQMAGMYAVLASAGAGTRPAGSGEPALCGLALVLPQAAPSGGLGEELRVAAGLGHLAHCTGKTLSEAEGLPGTPALSAQVAASLSKLARDGGFVIDANGVMLGVDAGGGWQFSLWVSGAACHGKQVDALWEAFVAKVADAAKALWAMESRAELAEATSRAKSQFLANVSHEIRTPLNAVLGMLKLLEGTSLTQRQLDYVTKSQGAARTLLLLLNDVLDFSKAEANKMTLDPRPFRVEQMLRDLSVILAASASEKPIEIVFDIDPAVPSALVGDDLRLQQVLINLGSNALKFTAAGQVVVRLRLIEQGLHGATIEFAVRDTGIGIARDHQAQIFVGFTQAEASTTRRFGGTGLGLAICDRLVRLMGGQIEVDSELGRGSEFRFRIRLPLAEGPVESAAPVLSDVAASARFGDAAPLRLGSDPHPQRLLAGLRLLLVEDNPNNQQVAQELLQAEGATVSLADNGQAGVDAVRRAQPLFDAVLLDLQMPVMDGFAATRALRADPAYRQLPIIAMTANAMADDREVCLAAGMTDYVSKPFEISDLVACLLRHTGRRTATAALAASAAASRDAVSKAIESLSPDLLSSAREAGVDLATALGRLGGRLDVYERMFSGFLSDLPVLLARLEGALGASSSAQAAVELHTLRGLAGTLGIHGLQADSLEAEKALRGGTSPSGAAPLEAHNSAPAFARLQAHAQRLSVAGASLAIALRTAAEPSGAIAEPTLDGAGLQQALQSLEDLLGRSDMGALEVLDVLRPALRAGHQERFAELAQAVHALEFDRAAQICRQLKSETTEPDAHSA